MKLPGMLLLIFPLLAGGKESDDDGMDTRMLEGRLVVRVDPSLTFDGAPLARLYVSEMREHFDFRTGCFRPVEHSQMQSCYVQPGQKRTVGFDAPTYPVLFRISIRPRRTGNLPKKTGKAVFLERFKWSGIPKGAETRIRDELKMIEDLGVKGMALVEEMQKIVIDPNVLVKDNPKQQLPFEEDLRMMRGSTHEVGFSAGALSGSAKLLSETMKEFLQAVSIIRYAANRTRFGNRTDLVRTEGGKGARIRETGNGSEEGSESTGSGHQGDGRDDVPFGSRWSRLDGYRNRFSMLRMTARREVCLYLPKSVNPLLARGNEWATSPEGKARFLQTLAGLETLLEPFREEEDGLFEETAFLMERMKIFFGANAREEEGGPGERTEKLKKDAEATPEVAFESIREALRELETKLRGK